MLYEYKCKNCDDITEVYQSMKDDALTHCSKCQTEGLERVIYGGIHAIVEREPVTLKDQAEKNTKNMGFYERQDREHKDNLRKKEVQLEMMKIGNMNDEQKRRYIENG